MSDEVSITLFVILFFGGVVAFLAFTLFQRLYYGWRDYQDRRRTTRTTGDRFYTRS